MFWILLLTATLAQTNWPQFRGPGSAGLADNPRLPDRWSETENVRWKTPIHGKGWSSPVVWDNQLWLTTATEDGKQLFVLCVDCATGKVSHDVKVFDVGQPQSMGDAQQQMPKFLKRRGSNIAGKLCQRGRGLGVVGGAIRLMPARVAEREVRGVIEFPARIVFHSSSL
jgi:hypothetical protein